MRNYVTSDQFTRYPHGNDSIQIVERHALLVQLFRGNQNFFDAVGQRLEVKANNENQFVLTVRAMALSEASRKVRKNLIRYRDGAEQ